MSKKADLNNEGDVKRQVKKLLDKHKWFWWMPPANGFGRTGISDFNVFRSGIFMAIETKFGKNEVTPMQKGFLESIRSEQGFAFRVDETNLEWLKVWLECFDRAIEAKRQQVDVAPEDGAAMLDAIRAMMW